MSNLKTRSEVEKANLSMFSGLIKKANEVYESEFGLSRMHKYIQKTTIDENPSLDLLFKGLEIDRKKIDFKDFKTMLGDSFLFDAENNKVESFAFSDVLMRLVNYYFEKFETEDEKQARLQAEKLQAEKDAEKAEKDAIKRENNKVLRAEFKEWKSPENKAKRTEFENYFNDVEKAKNSLDLILRDAEMTRKNQEALSQNFKAEQLKAKQQIDKLKADIKKLKSEKAKLTKAKPIVKTSELSEVI